MAAASTTTTVFPIFEVPAEIREWIYSYIILPPHSAFRNQVDDRRYYVNRAVCHQTSKNLLRTCRIINREVMPRFWANKSLVVTASTLESVVESLQGPGRMLGLDEFQHVEFNVHLALNSRHELKTLSEAYSVFLADQIWRLRRLRSVTFKVAEERIIEFDTFDQCLEDDHFGIASQDSCKQIDSEEEVKLQRSHTDCQPDNLEFMYWKKWIISRHMPDKWSCVILEKGYYAEPESLYTSSLRHGPDVYETQLVRRCPARCDIGSGRFGYLSDRGHLGLPINAVKEVNNAFRAFTQLSIGPDNNESKNRDQMN